MIDALRARLAHEREATGLPLGALILAALVVHLGVTLQAVNPWHPDEHFQILEFAWARAGRSPLADLPWEFPARIRPTLQPALAIAALRGLALLGVTSPYAWVLLLRLVSLALAFAVTVHVCLHAAPRLGRYARRTLWLAALFLWFTPLFAARFTSENWGGLALAAALPLIERDARGRSARDAVAGVLLGLSFVLRFQMAFAIGALLVWLPVAGGRAGLARAVRAAAAALVVVALATLCDAWFYRGWVFTPWEYLRVNLVEGVASTFGTEPWYWYLEQIPLWTAPPLGLALGVLVLVAAATRPRSPWVWAAGAFVLGHSMIAHKELRFLFPLLYLLPVLVAYGVERLGRRSPTLARVVAVQNAALVAVLLTPSIHRGKEFDWHFYRFLWRTAEARADAPLYVLQSGESPYRVWDLEGHVYRNDRIRPVAYQPGAPLGGLVPPGTSTAQVLLVTRDAEPPPLAGVHRFELVYQDEPGYRTLARAAGLDRTRALAWLERVDHWTDSRWVRRVYRVSQISAAAAATSPTGRGSS